VGVGPLAIVRLAAATVVGLVAAAITARRATTQFIGEALVAAIVEPTEAASEVGPVVGIWATAMAA